jgi:hypothetical protein
MAKYLFDGRAGRMRKGLVSIGMTAFVCAVVGGGAKAQAACECPPVSLEERIAGSVYIFSGKPLMFAQIPPESHPSTLKAAWRFPAACPTTS